MTNTPQPTEPASEPAAHQPTPHRHVWRAPLTAASEPDAFTMHGSMTLSGDTNDTYSGCTGAVGYSDIGDGTTVTVYDAEEHVLGVGELGETTEEDYGCTFSFNVSDVPKDEKFYQVEVAHRGKITYSAEQATSGYLEMSLGD